MLKNFNISSFKKLKPPSDSSFDTAQEIKLLKKIPLNKKFVKDNDNIESAFAKTAKDNNVKDYDKSIAANFIKKSAPIILDLKKYYNRKRPYELDSSLKAIVLKSMQTPSYPSGHSTQGTGIAKLLADKYPKVKSAFLKTGENISYSRSVARAHYKSDTKMGEQLGNSMYKHIKNKI